MAIAEVLETDPAKHTRMSGDLRGPESALNGSGGDAEQYCAQTPLTKVAENR